MSWKEFGRKRPWPIRGTILADAEWTKITMNLILTASTPLRYESVTCNMKDQNVTATSACSVLKTVDIERSDPGDHAVWGVDLRPLHCWTRGFQFRWESGCSSVVFAVWWVGSGLCDGLITRSEESSWVCICVYVCVCVCVFMYKCRNQNEVA